MNSPEEHSSPVRELLRLPDFLRLWLVGAFANAMRWLELLASGLFAYEVTGSALANCHSSSSAPSWARSPRR